MKITNQLKQMNGHPHSEESVRQCISKHRQILADWWMYEQDQFLLDGEVQVVSFIIASLNICSRMKPFWGHAALIEFERPEEISVWD